MHEYRVGNWYPFAGRLGTIEDPKTTVVVGALLCALAENRRIADFSLGTGGFTIESTANYIGRIFRDGSIKPEDVIFAREGGRFPTDSKTLAVSQPLFIGFRQLPLERWPATPLYFLDIDTSEKGYAEIMPWQVKFRREEPTDDLPAAQASMASESFWIDQIVDRNGNEVGPARLRLRLQTLHNADGYWLDTGIVSLD